MLLFDDVIYLLTAIG